MAGPSSRKRSYAELERSESPIDGPPSRYKRRRISNAASSTSTPTSRSPTPPQESTSPRIALRRGPASNRNERYERYEGDGLDFRTPVMPSPIQTIDLTADDDDPAPATLHHAQSRLRILSRESSLISRRTTAPPTRRAPPFGPHSHSPGPEVIDLLNDSDGVEPSINETDRGGAQPGTHSGTSNDDSPEVIFLSSRTLDPPPQNFAATRASRRLPTPPGLRNDGGLRGLSGFLQQSSNLLFGRSSGRNDQGTGNHEAILNRVDGLHSRQRPTGPAPHAVPDPGLGVEIFGLHSYVDVALNYEQPGFDIGQTTFGNIGLDMDRGSTPPEVIEQEPYKAPEATRNGFSRNLKEEDIVLCPGCNEELALGEGDIKQQVWVAKQCGHVYCGACAASRTTAKGANKRDKKNATQRKVLAQLKTCLVDGCKSKLSTKTAMIQIYL